LLAPDSIYDTPSFLFALDIGSMHLAADACSNEPATIFLVAYVHHPSVSAQALMISLAHGKGEICSMSLGNVRERCGKHC
jgi:hypothetical protein